MVTLAAVIALLFGADMTSGINGAFAIAGHRMLRWTLPHINVSAVILTIAAAWLLYLLRRQGRTPQKFGAAWALVLILMLLPGVGLALIPATSDAGAAIAAVLLTLVGAGLCAALANEAGHSLDFCVGNPGVPKRDRAAQAIGITAVMLIAHWATAPVMAILAQLPGAMTGTQTAALGLDNHPLVFVTDALIAGTREELVLVAMPILLMTAARRPTWQIYAVACAVRVVPHLYLGTIAFGVVVFAAAATWFYIHTRQITPIIAAHTIYNVLAVSGNTLAFLLTGAVVVAILLCTKKRTLLTPAGHLPSDRRPRRPTSPITPKDTPMSDQVSPPQAAEKPKPLLLLDFPTAMGKLPVGRPLGRLSAFLIVPAAFLGVGLALASWLPTLALYIAPFALGITLVSRLRSRARLRLKVDWDTALTYADEAKRDMEPHVRAIIEDSLGNVARRLGERAAHLYILRPRDGHDCDSRKHCGPTCLNAGIQPFRDHPIVLVGSGLLHAPDALRFTLAHEQAHLRRAPLLVPTVIAVLLSMGFFTVGATVPGAWISIVAPALWVAILASNWALEIRCDLHALRQTGPGLAAAAFRNLRAIDLSLSFRILRLVTPTHPPVVIRAAIVRRASRRVRLVCGGTRIAS